ncbi:MAG TPA: carboxylesterase family protein, partial [Acidimicrobiales bacterium]
AAGPPDAGGRRGRTFVYRFDWPAAPPHARLGACHGIDIPFTFGTLDRCGWGEFVGADADATSLSRAVREAWAAFATSGDPSMEAAGPWPAYDLGTRATMALGRRVGLVHDPSGDRRRAWAAARREPYTSCK